MRFSAVLFAAAATLSVASTIEEPAPEMAVRDYDELEERDELAGDAADLNVRYSPFSSSLHHGRKPIKDSALRSAQGARNKGRRGVDDLDTRSPMRPMSGFRGVAPRPYSGGRGRRNKRGVDDLEVRSNRPMKGPFLPGTVTWGGKAPRDVDDLEVRSNKPMKGPLSFPVAWGGKAPRDVDDLEVRRAGGRAGGGGFRGPTPRPSGGGRGGRRH